MKNYYTVLRYPIIEENLVIREDSSMEEWGIAMATTIDQLMPSVNYPYVCNKYSKGLADLMLSYYYLN
jgi:hypothetical protein